MIRNRFLAAGAVLLLLALTRIDPYPVRATAAGLAADPEATLDNQVDVAVTVYNSNLALVRDVRELTLAEGESDVRFVDIAATVNPATVHLRSVSEPSRVSVVEQNYEYDLLEPDKLLRKYVGRTVTMVRTKSDNGTTREEEVKATLVSLNNGPIWKIGDEYVTGLHADHLRFPELPANLYSRPTLVWRLANRGGARHRLEASYLASGLSWNADYVLIVGRDDRAADLDGWVTLTNRSGTAFRSAKLQLVAGDLNRVQPSAQRMRDLAMEAKAAAAPAMTQEAFSEYHLYTLGRRTTVSNDETKQVSLLAATDIPVEKRYLVHGQEFYYRDRHRPGAPIKDNVQVFYRFKNDAKSGLGLPMPAGVIRVYQADANGGTHFVGEDRIDHTPKDETLDLKIGNAFDVVCERNQVDFEKIADSVYEVEFEIVLRNHKSAPVLVQVNEPVGGTWRMVRSTHDWKKTAAWAVQFDVPVAADGTATLKYRVRVSY
ncbi:MAG: DUF4139 domain-containing protein [Acidobacteria bacterium]|nr:DUF4139 domain-containing protein [Acidobacteriota bacterium]